MEKTILWVTMLILALFMLAVIPRILKGPRFTDRIISVNAVNTMVISVICLMSAYLDADYLIDVALIYALLGFMANVLLMRTLLARITNRKKKEEK